MTNIIPIERAHAKLSASGSKKWLTCTRSAALEDQFPDEQGKQLLPADWNKRQPKPPVDMSDWEEAPL